MRSAIGGDLGRSLADAEDDLGESLPERAMRIDARKAEVLERRRAERAEDARGRGGRIDRAGAYVIEQLLQLRNGHSRRGFHWLCRRRGSIIIGGVDRGPYADE